MPTTRHIVLISIIACLLGGCGVADRAAPSSSAQRNTDAAKQSERPPHLQCPSRDFNAFLKAFANSVEVQKAFTQDPYKTVIDDDIHMDTGPETAETPLSKVEFPVMLGDKALVENGASMESTRKTDDWIQVSTHSEGTGAYSMTFNFHFRHDCWYLTDSLDTST